MRLDRFLAETGFGTRTEVKKLIKLGKVLVNGETAKKAELHIDPQTADVKVDGNAAVYRKFIYLMLNKPCGYVSATWDKKLPTVIDLLPEQYRHFEPFPVGRLDIDTEGLLLLTNDGELSHRLLSPKHHVPKTYIAEVERCVTNSDIAAFKQGVTLDDGYKTLSAELKGISDKAPFWAEITISEGKFHQVKRMFEAVGSRVLYLKRVKMKNLVLDENLDLGEIRELTEQEISHLVN
ncbi:MAG: rRNA pseudouridine synthase [Clostridia bacterium]|nr:rRNA pseudouridine synthase [Clostridia bacterium]